MLEATNSFLQQLVSILEKAPMVFSKPAPVLPTIPTCKLLQKSLHYLTIIPIHLFTLLDGEADAFQDQR